MKETLKRSSIYTIFLQIITLVLLAGCGKQAPTKSAREPLPDEYKKVVESIRVTERKGGNPSFSLEAGKLIELQNYIEFQDLGEVLTYSEGKPEMKLSADLANWYERQNRLEAIGDVLVRAVDEDFSLKTPKLTYKTQEELFETDGFAIVETDRYILTSDSLVGDVKEKTIYASGNMELKDSDGLEIKGKSLEFNWETQSYRIKGPIVVKIHD